MNICPTCTRVINKGFVKLDCGHTFHTACAQTWWAFHGNCPVCAGTIDEPPRPNINLEDVLKGTILVASIITLMWPTIKIIGKYL